MNDGQYIRKIKKFCSMYELDGTKNTGKDMRINLHHKKLGLFIVKFHSNLF